MSTYSIAENFGEFFSIEFANSKKLREAAYRIRYSVYSDELGWEPKNKDKIETDECDHYAYHCLLKHKRTNAYIGCIRLIVPPHNSPKTKLPFEKNCLHSARPHIKDSTKLDRGSFGEISRLAVLSSFRRRKKEKETPFVINETDKTTQFSEQERRNFPNIAIGLYLSGLALAELFNHCGIFVMMEPRLNVLLNRLGLPFVQAGDEIDYHGKRAIFFLDRLKFHQKQTSDLQALYQLIYTELSNQVRLTPYLDLTEK